MTVSELNSHWIYIREALKSVRVHYNAPIGKRKHSEFPELDSIERMVLILLINLGFDLPEWGHELDLSEEIS